MGNIFITEAYDNTLKDPYQACHYNNEMHPLFHRCEICPSLYKCDLSRAIDYRCKSEEEIKFEKPEDFDPYWACLEGDTTHPLYHKCGQCNSYWRCAQRDNL